MPRTRVTLLDIAKELHVSVMSVSVALRGKPGVSTALRERVLAAAERLGYVPNAAAAELMSAVRAHRDFKDSGNLIAYINPWLEPDRWRESETFSKCHEGASRQAERYGYRLEQFAARTPGMSDTRLTNILKARGVRGVLLGARGYDDPEIALDWSAFSTVVVGEARYGPSLHRVSNDHMQTCVTCLRRLAALGYERIGVALRETYERTRGYDHVLGVELFRRETGGRGVVETLLYDEWDEAVVTRWLRENDLDAIVAHAPEFGYLVPKLRTARGEAVGLALTDLDPRTGWSGVNQHSEEIGGAAMDLLRGLLLAGERGEVARRQVVLLEGQWVDGWTTRRVSDCTRAV